jgi:hypothetical protein
MNPAGNIAATHTNSADFYLSIGLSGDQQRRHRRTVLISESRVNSTQSEPFQEIVVISMDVFQSVLESLKDNGCTFLQGSYVGDEPQYFANISADGTLFNCSLGLDEKTLRTMDHLVSVLAEKDRHLLQPMIEELRTILNHDGH